MLLAFAAVAATVWGVNAATYYPVTINYEPSTTITNFPVLVRVSEDSEIYKSAGEGGANLRFTDALGINNYPHEVDTWNAEGESLVWVLIPELKNGFAFRLYCSGEDTTAAKDVWSAYAGVWHLSEAKDSSENDIDPVDGVTHTTTIWGDRVGSAVIGGGYGRSASDVGPTFGSKVYDDRNGNKSPIHVTNPSRFTVSGWFNLVDPECAWKVLFAEYHQTTGNTGWSTVFSAKNGSSMELRQCGGSGSQLVKLQNLSFSGWTKFDVIYDFASLALYTNGVLVSKQDVSAQTNPVWYYTSWLGWGGCVTANGEAVASGASGMQFDECRIYDGVKSADRIAADYATVMQYDVEGKQDFLSIGPAEEEQSYPPGTVAQVGASYFQDFAAAVAESKSSGDHIVLMANGQSWTLFIEDDSIAVKLNGMEFNVGNGRPEGYYIETAFDPVAGVTTYTLKRQIEVVAMRNVAVYKQLHTRDLATLLPAQVAGLDEHGEVVGLFDVAWEVADITVYDHFGVTPVPGIATVGGERKPVTAFVRATLSYSDDYHNIAPEAASLHTVVPPTDDDPGETDELKISNNQNTSVITNGLTALADVLASWPVDATAPYVNWGTRAKKILTWTLPSRGLSRRTSIGWRFIVLAAITTLRRSQSSSRPPATRWPTVA